jgi:hypothetical protein
MGVMALPILRRWSFLPPLLEPDELSLNAKEIRKVLVIQLGEEDRAVLTSPFCESFCPMPGSGSLSGVLPTVFLKSARIWMKF